MIYNMKRRAFVKADSSKGLLDTGLSLSDNFKRTASQAGFSDDNLSELKR